jgi:hypothetical protein
MKWHYRKSLAALIGVAATGTFITVTGWIFVHGPEWAEWAVVVALILGLIFLAGVDSEDEW